MNSKLALIAFILCQAYPALSQQQNPNPTQTYVPGGWFRPIYSAAAEAWRDYLIRAQQATNQFYQQWANMTGMNNQPGGIGLGGLGGLYGGGNQQQGATGQTPRPQGIFNPANIPTGLDMSELLPGNQKPGRQGPELEPPLEDEPQKETTTGQPQKAEMQTAPPVQQPPTVQQDPPVQQSSTVQQVPVAQQPPIMQQAPPVQQPSIVQQVPAAQQPSIVQQAPPVQQVPVAQQTPTVQQAPAVQQSPPVQQVPRVQPQSKPAVQQLQQQQLQTQTQNRPSPVTNTIGMFGGATPLGWIG